jgi:co-chaperonin GroES (HSP10)
LSAQTVQDGTRIGNETYTCVPKGAKIRPLRDQIILEPLPWPFSDTIEVVYTGRPLRGKVKAIGPGVYPKRYNGPKGVRTKSWDSKAFRPCDVKIGDVVQIGGLGIDGYLFQTFNWGGVEHVICREADVTGIET